MGIYHLSFLSRYSTYWCVDISRTLAVIDQSSWHQST